MAKFPVFPSCSFHFSSDSNSQASNAWANGERKFRQQSFFKISLAEEKINSGGFITESVLRSVINNNLRSMCGDYKSTNDQHYFIVDLDVLSNISLLLLTSIVLSLSNDTHKINSVLEFPRRWPMPKSPNGFSQMTASKNPKSNSEQADFQFLHIKHSFGFSGFLLLILQRLYWLQLMGWWQYLGECLFV